MSSLAQQLSANQQLGQVPLQALPQQQWAPDPKIERPRMMFTGETAGKFDAYESGVRLWAVAVQLYRLPPTPMNMLSLVLQSLAGTAGDLVTQHMLANPGCFQTYMDLLNFLRAHYAKEPDCSYVHWILSHTQQNSVQLFNNSFRKASERLKKLSTDELLSLLYQSQLHPEVLDNMPSRGQAVPLNNVMQEANNACTLLQSNNAAYSKFVKSGQMWWTPTTPFWNPQKNNQPSRQHEKKTPSGPMMKEIADPNKKKEKSNVCRNCWDKNNIHEAIDCTKDCSRRRCKGQAAHLPKNCPYNT
jgi:hypothetical protein